MPAAMKSRSWCMSGMACSSSLEERAHRRDGALDTCAVDAQVSGKPKAIKPGREHPVRLQVIEQGLRPFARGADEIDEHDVGVRRLDLQAFNARETIGQALGNRVVFGQPV